MKTTIILYMPVLHRGYLDFFSRHIEEADTVYILGSDLIGEAVFLEKEIRAVDPSAMSAIVGSVSIPNNGATAFYRFKNVWVLSRNNVRNIQRDCRIIAAGDSLTRRVVEKFFPANKKTFDTVFLQWDEKNVFSKKPVNFDMESVDKFDRKMMELARQEGEKSSDWWRRVGAVLVGQGEQILARAHNVHVPSEHSPYADGDPRDFIEPGKMSEFSSAPHAEQLVIAEAAREGKSTKGADIYVSVFPCPSCAKLIAPSGIKRCFFGSGHASLDGERVLKEKGVLLVYVK